MKTVRDSCQLQPNALSIKLSDQIEQLDWKRRSKSAAGGGPIVQHPTAVNAFTFCGSSKALTVRSVN
jgi:hypothetical protein